MNATHCPMTALQPGNAAVSTGPAQPGPILHHLRSVRRREGISNRSIAHRLGISLGELKAQEVETTDLPLSVLHRWAAALNVPVTELVAEPTTDLSLPLVNRTRLLRVMKTVKAILEQANQLRVKRMAKMLVEQLVELMPELAEVSPWNSTGFRRRRCDLGRAADYAIPYRLQVEDRAAP
jgi:transcriptional regulator with XRE-family HTH domain